MAPFLRSCGTSYCCWLSSYTIYEYLAVNDPSEPRGLTKSVLPRPTSPKRKKTYGSKKTNTHLGMVTRFNHPTYQNGDSFNYNPSIDMSICRYVKPPINMFLINQSKCGQHARGLPVALTTFQQIPSGKLKQLWEITMFNWKTQYFNGHIQQKLSAITRQYIHWILLVLSQYHPIIIPIKPYEATHEITRPIQILYIIIQLFSSICHIPNGHFRNLLF